MKWAVFLYGLLFISITSARDISQLEQSNQPQSRLYFIENKGQWHSDVLYLARMGNFDAWITKYGVNYTFYKLEEVQTPKRQQSIHLHGKFNQKEFVITGQRVLVKLKNHYFNPTSQGVYPNSMYSNYFIGNDPSRYATNVRQYKEVWVKDVYPGIDLRYYFDKGSLRYDYIVHAGANPSHIIFNIDGSNQTYLNDKGHLVFETRFGEVVVSSLFVYQEKDKRKIDAKFVCFEGENWGFSLGKYDKTQDLIIDPLIYSTFIGGTHDEEALDIDVDNNGNAYITGWTASINYDITPGSFQTTNLAVDAFITKINSTGSSIIYSTFIGGSGYENANSIKVDGFGNVFITGKTNSTDYSTTANAYQTNNDGYYDAFISKLNAAGTNLLYSTYLGGMSEDVGNAIAINESGNAYITGYTYSSNFDTTLGAFRTTSGIIGGVQAFLTQLDSTGSSLVFSTYFGGDFSCSLPPYGSTPPAENNGNDIAVDTHGFVYITGYTTAVDFPITPNAFQSWAYHSNNTCYYHAFVTKFNPTESELVYSTFLGGNNNDIGNAIAVDSLGNAYITGTTFSTNFPTSPDAYQTSSAGNVDIFITKLNDSGSNIIFSTYLGGSDYDGAFDIAIDDFYNVYVTGRTTSLNFDVTEGTLQNVYKGGSSDGFITKLNSTGTSVTFSSYLGGVVKDYANGLAVSNSNEVYLTGLTASYNFPISSGSFQLNQEGKNEVFVTKIETRNAVIGYVFQDLDKDCIKDIKETEVSTPLMVTIQPGNQTLWTERGKWQAYLPVGSYTVTVDTMGEWKASCLPSASFTITHPDSSFSITHIGMQKANPCPDPQISLFMPFVSPCSLQYIKVEICNSPFASQALYYPFAEITLPSILTFSHASMPYTALGNGVYRFQVDSLYPSECKTFNIFTFVSCSVSIGQTICVEGRLLPEIPCAFDTTPNHVHGVSPCTLPWDHSSLSVDGFCVNDSVRFVIRNTAATGQGDMQCFMPIRLYVDGQWIKLDSLKINGGDSLVIQFAGDGRTWRLEADQHPLHPGNSHPNATVEACGNGGFSSPDWTPKLVNIMPLDDADPFKDVYCGEVDTAYSSNKTGFPIGTTSNRFISPNQPIEYVIRFKNNLYSSDRLIIRDNIDTTKLDISSIRLRVSSHPYSFRIDGSTLEWVFLNINLQYASLGFVTFAINQKADLPDYTQILNKAEFYFNFADSANFTNTSKHTVLGQSLVVGSDKNFMDVNSGMRVYPIPSNGKVQVEWGTGTCIVELLNVQGQVLGRYEMRGGKGTIDMSAYPAGLYLLKGTHGGGVGVVKVVKE